jgi:hypothetical protein
VLAAAAGLVEKFNKKINKGIETNVGNFIQIYNLLQVVN